MKTTFALAIVLATLLGAQAHTMKFFSGCPTYTSAMSSDRFNQTAFGGLWFEYLYDTDFKEDIEYDCASWNLLAGENGRYDLLFNSQNRTTGASGMLRYNLQCGKEYTPASQTCRLTSRAAPTRVHEWTLNRPRNFQIIDTDMFSYAVASACYDYKVAH